MFPYPSLPTTAPLGPKLPPRLSWNVEGTAAVVVVVAADVVIELELEAEVVDPVDALDVGIEDELMLEIELEYELVGVDDELIEVEDKLKEVEDRLKEVKLVVGVEVELDVLLEDCVDDEVLVEVFAYSEL
ncbi:hypothetical protein MMC20_006899 [Loxospora ochrophaea]|nr:hypothetical protein [Loxospora ochrophaea]